ELKKYNLIQTLISYEYATALNRQGVSIKAHLKIDTGMHRLGISNHDINDIEKVFSLKYITVCGIYTHLCCPDSLQANDVAFTHEQINRFYSLIHALRDRGIAIPKLHIQSSYGFFNYPELQCDYVRAGIALYGVLSSPYDETVRKLDLRPVLSLQSEVILIRSIPKGDHVGYGRAFIAERDSRIAIIPIGYADGIPRNLSCGKGMIRIKQYFVPIIGRICMDQLAVDITEAEDIAVGDIATLIEAKTDSVFTAPVVADHTGSISNELLCRMGTRLPVTCSN
ncbi:MAG TPA: alanine racemase, partial [Firmicutes bacterium]|nr:alanine racemase [Bacillota bacterium]